ncbi:hypothetical protein B7463_g4292, partial [Scytalidium lignicola]
MESRVENYLPRSGSDMEATTTSSIETSVRKGSAFDSLPDEIIELILQLTNPDSFASLILLNRKWRGVSQQAYLYAHHLSKCPSYLAAHPIIPEFTDEESLPRLRGLFAREIKRNLFEAYLRPSETTIRLVSNSISSSSAPGGEAFHFDISPQGRFVLAYSSSRIHVIDVTEEKLTVKRELKILRRPLSTTITDDGALLAVLSTDLHVNLYDLTGERPKHIRVITLENTPRTIALSPTASVLAAAYENGVEVLSLDPDYLNSGGRAVKCYTVDALSFSRDGTQLLGTTLHSQNPSIVVLSAPSFSPGGQPPEQSVSALWTTSILFPNGSRDCSHAVLLPQPFDGESSWTFTYDRVFETFRAVRIDDLRNGTTYFTGPAAEVDTVARLLPSTLPAASCLGDLVAAGFQGSVWIYGVPEDLDAPPVINNGSNSNAESEVTTPSTQIGRRNSVPSLYSVPPPSSTRASQWQLLSDKFRNTFVQGRKISALDGVKAVSWVNNKHNTILKERLVAVAPGVGPQHSTFEDDGMDPVDGGRISLLDFDYSTSDGTKNSITIEVGVIEPEILEEEQRDMDTEVAIVRRRTVAQRRGKPSNVARSTSTVVRPNVPVPPLPKTHDEPSDPSTSIETRQAPQLSNVTDVIETASIDEEQEAFDAPYSQSAPRSVTTLRRAATAAAANRRLHPRTVAGDHIEYRRADGREEHPHESDADNWVPPPPPYSKDPVPTLPEHLQRAVLGETFANLQRVNIQRNASIISGFSESNSLHRSHTTASSTSSFRRQQETSFHRSFGDSTARNIRRNSSGNEVPRPVTSPVSPGFDDLYDVSPPRSPQPAPAVPVRNQSTHQIPRRPVGANVSVPVTIGSDKPATNGSLQQTISQSPQRMVGSTINQSANQEPATEYDQVPSTGLDTVFSPSLTRYCMDQPAPQHLNEDHHVTEPLGMPVHPGTQVENWPLQTTSPQRSQTDPDIGATRVPKQEGNYYGPLSTGRRSDTAPAALTERQSGGSSSGMTMPTAEQLARLNTRKGPPPSLTLTDPSRRRATPFNQTWQTTSRTVSDLPPAIGHPAEYSHQHNSSRQNLTSSTSQATHGSSQPSRTSYPQSSSRHLSNNTPNPRHLSSPGVPSPMQRLETVYSVASSGEPSPYHPRAMTIGRQPSRAERSAAKNINDAKKKGWKAGAKLDKRKKKDNPSHVYHAPDSETSFPPNPHYLDQFEGIKGAMVDYAIPYNPWAEEAGNRSPITLGSVRKISQPESPIKKASLFLKRVKKTDSKETEAFNGIMTANSPYDAVLSLKSQNLKAMDLSTHSPASLSSLTWGSRKDSVDTPYSPQSKSAQKILQLTGFDPSYDVTSSWIPRQEYAESLVSSLSSGSIYSQDEYEARSEDISMDSHKVLGKGYIKSSGPSSSDVSGTKEERGPPPLPRISSLRYRDRSCKKQPKMEEQVWVDARKSSVVDDRIAQEMARYKECFLPEIWEETILTNFAKKPIVYPPDPHPGELYPHPLVIQKPLFGIKSSKRLSDAPSEAPSSPLASARESVVLQIRHMSAFLKPKNSEPKSNRGSGSPLEDGPNRLELILPPPPPGKRKNVPVSSPSKHRFSLSRNHKRNTQDFLTKRGSGVVSKGDPNINSPLLPPERVILANAARRIDGPDTPMPQKPNFPSVPLGSPHMRPLYDRRTDKTRIESRINRDHRGKAIEGESVFFGQLDEESALSRSSTVWLVMND